MIKWKIFNQWFSLRRKKIELLNNIINLIYLPVCAFCGKIDKNFLCENCRKNLQEIEKVHLDKCKSKYYEEHAYMFKYKAIRDKILAYKFDDKAYYYKTFVNILLNIRNMIVILIFLQTMSAFKKFS